MSELPDNFEAVDPVSGESFDLRVSYDCFRWHVKDTGHVLASYRASMIRALIQYGRDLERARIEKALKVDYNARRKAANAKALYRDDINGAVFGDAGGN